MNKNNIGGRRASLVDRHVRAFNCHSGSISHHRSIVTSLTVHSFSMIKKKETRFLAVCFVQSSLGNHSHNIYFFFSNAKQPYSFITCVES